MNKKKKSARHFFASLAKAARKGQDHEHVARHVDRAFFAHFRDKTDRDLDRKLAQSVRLSGKTPRPE